MEQFFSFVDKYSIMLGNNPIHPMVFLVIAIILILLFIIKGNIVFFTRKKESKEKGIYKEFIAYIFGNEGLSFLFSFLVSLFIVIVSGNNVDNDSLNFFISPLIGFLSSLWFENQMEKNNILKNPFDTLLLLPKTPYLSLFQHKERRRVSLYLLSLDFLIYKKEIHLCKNTLNNLDKSFPLLILLPSLL